MSLLRFRFRCWLGLLLCGGMNARAGTADTTLKMLVSPPFTGPSGRVELDYSLLLPQEGHYQFRVRSYQLRPQQDSVLLWDLLFERPSLPAGPTEGILYPDQASRVLYRYQGFPELLQAVGTFPAGQYRTQLTLLAHDSVLAQRSESYVIDSLLPAGTPLRSKVNELLALPPARSSAAGLLSSGKKESAALLREQETATGRRLSRKLSKAKDLRTRPVSLAGKSYSEVYWQDWFIGRYELAGNRALQQRISTEQQTLQSNASTLVPSGLEDFQGVSSQIRALYGRNNQEQPSLEGTIDWNNTFGTAADPNSQQDANYSELYGSLSTKILNIPVAIEGYYTTQDLHREAKASYLRIRYDADKAKDELMNLISAYRQKYNEVSAKGKGLTQIYSSYLQQLQGTKDQMLHDFGKEYGVDGNLLASSGGNTSRLLQQVPALLDTTGLRQRLMTRLKDTTQADSAVAALQQQYQQKRQKLQQETQQIRERYARLQALEQKADKYRTLLSQYQDGLSLDSALHYARLEALAQNKNATYKDMAKAAEGLLPEGKIKQFSTGLTHLEAGILNPYASSYTMAGQTLKGGSIGYDAGIGTVSISAGKTEYISRDGNLDRYNSYSAGFQFKEWAHQQIGLIYYGYSPTRQITNDAFFKNTDASIPTFQNSVHIGSITYQGQVGKNLLLEAEGASSLKQAEHPTIGMSNAALKAGAEYQLAALSTTLKVEWEHIGTSFENNALPLSQAGTERYTAGIDLSLFRSFLSLGITYNELRQDNFSSASTNRRWGAEIRTHSKRYPNLTCSYKPFSTFRAYNDTLAVPQRPLTGAVWTGRGSYQIKRGPNIHRFTLIYNSNRTSGGDTLQYQSATAQAGYSYSASGNTLGANIGLMEVPTLIGQTDGYATGRTWFANASCNRILSRQTSVQLAEDIGMASYGLQRLSTTAGLSWRMKTIPLTLRLTCRYTSYRLSEDGSQEGLWAGQAGMSWQFKMKP